MMDQYLDMFECAEGRKEKQGRGERLTPPDGAEHFPVDRSTKIIASTMALNAHTQFTPRPGRRRPMPTGPPKGPGHRGTWVWHSVDQQVSFIAWEIFPSSKPPKFPQPSLWRNQPRFSGCSSPPSCSYLTLSWTTISREARRLRAAVAAVCGG